MAPGVPPLFVSAIVILPLVVIGELPTVKKPSELVRPTDVTVPPVPAAGINPIISDIANVFVGFSPLGSDVNVPISRSAEVGLSSVSQCNCVCRKLWPAKFC